jgi:hypothetical protein
VRCRKSEIRSLVGEAVSALRFVSGSAVTLTHSTTRDRMDEALRSIDQAYGLLDQLSP